MLQDALSHLVFYEHVRHASRPLELHCGSVYTTPGGVQAVFMLCAFGQNGKPTAALKDITTGLFVSAAATSLKAVEGCSAHAWANEA